MRKPKKNWRCKNIEPIIKNRKSEIDRIYVVISFEKIVSYYGICLHPALTYSVTYNSFESPSKAAPAIKKFFGYQTNGDSDAWHMRAEISIVFRYRPRCTLPSGRFSRATRDPAPRSLTSVTQRRAFPERVSRYRSRVSPASVIVLQSMADVRRNNFLKNSNGNSRSCTFFWVTLQHRKTQPVGQKTHPHACPRSTG